MSDDEKPFPEPIPAATLVVFRPAASGPPELLMTERAKAMAFAAGALVFPGGRVDPGDRALAVSLGAADADTEDGAARIAAIRETVEEAGLPIGLSPMPDAATTDRLRRALAEGTPFGAALADEGLALAPDRLVPFARWCPRHRHLRIFDTRFYLAELPPGAPAPTADATEAVRLFWASAADVLAAAARGEARLIFPTRRNLERLALFDSFADAVADASLRPVRTVTPWEEHRDGVAHLCIPDDLGYPVTSEPLDAAMRS